jgi:predicted ATP-dependent endonuclease of OLD family
VINLRDVFGKDDTTDKFVTRYLQTTHCDLFFADAVILVEGAAESMLVPHFIKNHFPVLNQRYISILGISGKHSHRLKSLIEKLCLTTLIIADLDSASPEGHHAAACPERGKDLISSNYAITGWLIKKKKLDELLKITFKEKEFKLSSPYSYSIRVAYQNPVTIKFKESEDFEAISSTFEDCLIYHNLSLFGEKSGEGIIDQVKDLLNKCENPDMLHKSIYSEIRKSDSKKASFALDLIYSFDPIEITIPKYIKEALVWLQEQIIQNN